MQSFFDQAQIMALPAIHMIKTCWDAGSTLDMRIQKPVGYDQRIYGEIGVLFPNLKIGYEPIEIGCQI